MHVQSKVDSESVAVDLQITVVSEALRLPSFAMDILDSEVDIEHGHDLDRANLILSTLQRCADAEAERKNRSGGALDMDMYGGPGHRYLWIVVHVGTDVKFIASCHYRCAPSSSSASSAVAATESRGNMGPDLELSIYTPFEFKLSDRSEEEEEGSLPPPEWMKPALKKIARALIDNVDIEYHYGRRLRPGSSLVILGQDVAVSTFGDVWEEMRVEVEGEGEGEDSAEGDCNIGHSDTQSEPDQPATVVEAAEPDMGAEIAELCKRFAEDTEPFIMTKKAAMKEARILVNAYQNRQVWG